MKRTYWIVLVGMGSAIYACGKKDVTNNASASLFSRFEVPANFPQPVYNVANNEVTEAGFTLGRKLFYEPRLSRNNTISCGSCHIQTSAFTQHGHDVSHGIDDLLGTRNSPPIMNLAWSPAYMWDGGVFNLDLQPIAPITNPVEMDETIENVISKLKVHPDYPGLFKKAFGTEDITNARMMKALSQFMVRCVSSNAKYDSVVRKQGGVTFTNQEQEGYALFQAKCSSCHTEPLFTNYSFRNNGLSITAVKDQGHYLVTLQDTDKYKFKVPSLRNLAYTAPFMHDGRYLTVNAVLNHYTGNVQATANLDPLLQKNGNLGIALTDEEKTKLLAFLNTLNDKKFITDKLLSEQ